MNNKNHYGLGVLTGLDLTIIRDNVGDDQTLIDVIEKLISGKCHDEKGCKKIIEQIMDLY